MSVAARVALRGPVRPGRIPNAVHGSGPWRIGEITADFTLEDAWALPVHGRAEDFEALIDTTLDADPTNPEDSVAARVLWRIRDLMGSRLGIGRVAGAVRAATRERGDPLAIPGTSETSLRGRLPADLRDTVAGLRFRRVPFVPIYRTDVEFAAELSNRTVHGVLHLAWVERAGGSYQGQMGVYVKPRGRLGEGYMALIKPFRYLVVYPALLRQMERTWKAR